MGRAIAPGDGKMGLDACNRLVREADPHLHATAMFAREPQRSRLMVLYAFDIELSRAVQAAGADAIPQMRLQWWHDVVQDAASRKPPERHEVAGPLYEQIAAGWFSPDLLLSMISGHARELERPLDSESLWYWAEERFAARLIQAALVAAATSILDDAGRAGADGALPALWQRLMPLGQVIGAAFAIEHAAAMAAAGQAPLMLDLSGEDRAALAKGELTGRLRGAIARRADHYLRQIEHSRSDPLISRNRYVPALLPLARSARILEAARRPDFAPRQFDKVDRPFDGLRLAWRARTGRW